MFSMCCLTFWLPQKPKKQDQRQSRRSVPYTPPRNYHRNPSPGKDRPSSKRKVIYFYKKNKPYYSFTNLSGHHVRYRGRLYPTSEHLFQAMKFMDSSPDIAENIRNTPRPSDASDLAREHQAYVPPGWYRYNISTMDEVLRLKFTQHGILKSELLSTGNAELIQDSPTDAFWGNGANKKGSNELGKALMRLRATFQGNETPVIRQIPSGQSEERTRQVPATLSPRTKSSLDGQDLARSKDRARVGRPKARSPLVQYGAGSQTNITPRPFSDL
ncbi:hypothetical protein M408DRAFT_113456 [Serendipita vermifera MAFF 305830]|uniref:NADAR domain-containing protein n=1 Tax=Serendipita vermifera MAFF 305830 TaxID=933852 RepID=A0A0C3AY15_SERVB|nr:hypothetical protein M408DRAFT_113456 [Serendipita vermifera MAFF 305830]